MSNVKAATVLEQKECRLKWCDVGQKFVECLFVESNRQGVMLMQQTSPDIVLQ